MWTTDQELMEKLDLMQKLDEKRLRPRVYIAGAALHDKTRDRLPPAHVSAPRQVQSHLLSWRWLLLSMFWLNEPKPRHSLITLSSRFCITAGQRGPVPNK